MSVELKNISCWLDNLEMKYEIKEDEDKILLGLNHEGIIYGVVIEIEEDGGLLQIYCNQFIDEEQNILKVKNHKYLLLILQHILNINYKEKFGAWEFDLFDGEVRFAVETILEDSIMTEKQFERVLGHVLDSQKGFTQINHIMNTGELPEDDEMDMIAELFRRMLLENTTESTIQYDTDSI